MHFSIEASCGGSSAVSLNVVALRGSGTVKEEAIAAEVKPNERLWRSLKAVA